MHILQPIFGMERTEALDFAAHRGFGLVAACDGTRPIGSHLPFNVVREGDAETVQFHVTPANPLADLVDDSRRFLVVATGADAYVSNDWYTSPDQVSTWLYEAVHLTGIGRRLPKEANRRHGDALLWASERTLVPKRPWHLDLMHPARREAMLAAIVTIEVTVETVEGQRKLNQHKSDADHVSVVRALEASGDPGQQITAGRLRALRPSLDYGPAHLSVPNEGR